MPVLQLYLLDITAPLKIPRMSKLTCFFFFFPMDDMSEKNTTTL